MRKIPGGLGDWSPSLAKSAFSPLRFFAFSPTNSADEPEFETLRQQRVRIGTMDLRIASIALARGYTVLTRNLVDFEKVPGLAAEDWTRP